MHIGGIRTALFNWLFSKNQKGNFYLRIEDTDKERSKDEFKKQIISSSLIRKYLQNGKLNNVNKLLKILHKLVNEGNTVIVIEHNLDVIKTADHIIDLGPLGGNKGGEIICTGKPEEVAKNKKSFTGKYLRKYI